MFNFNKILHFKWLALLTIIFFYLIIVKVKNMFLTIHYALHSVMSQSFQPF